ncbi:MAG: rod shape-determining protein [Chloroflexi bacterium]|nr:rod shape-determining protein [Chloroflexota bacterium]
MTHDYSIANLRKNVVLCFVSGRNGVKSPHGTIRLGLQRPDGGSTLAFNPLNWLLGLFSLDIGIDLGTANTLVNVLGKGIVINEPSWVAIEKKSRRPLAIGTEARQMVGRTPANIIAIRPLRDGVISDFEITEAMLEYFIGKAHEQSIVPVPRPRVVVGIPSGATDVEKRAVYDATMAAGAREAFLIEEPTAAALGASLPIGEIRGSMVVDIGGGTTEVAVFAMGGVVVSRSLRVAGDELDQDIVNYVRNKYNLLIGERMAERAKVTIGSAYPLKEEKTITVRGRNLVSGLPEAVEISSVEIREALSSSVAVIVETIKDAIDETPPELIADLMEVGICLAGGGSQLQGLPDRLTNELRTRVWIAEDPMTCVARGAGIILENLDINHRFLVGLQRRGL